MKRALISAGLTAGMVLGLLAAVITAPPAHAGGCPNVARYTVGGNGDPGSTHVPRVPWPYTPITYSANVFQGDGARIEARNKLDRVAHQMRAACPGTRIEVWAYSLGASAASATVDWWQTDRRMNHNTIAYFYGDPRRPNHGGYGGIEASGIGNIPGVYTWWGPHRYGVIPVIDICHPTDGVCNVSIPWNRNLNADWAGFWGYATGGAHLY